jgi:4-hydroxymandelate oxidase
MNEPLNLYEYETLAKSVLTPATYDYYASGAMDEVTLRENLAAYDRVKLAYRVLVDVSRRDLSTAFLGAPLSLPVMIAPTAFHRLAHEDGELAVARAAARAGTAMLLSSLSNTDVEAVVRATSAPVLFQLYVYKDRGATEALMQRAEAAGARAIVVTVDAPFLGRRERDVRNRFELPPELTVKNLVPEGYGEVKAPPAGSGLASYFETLIDPALTWKDLDWLRQRTRLPLVIKGLVRADDARRALDAGASAVVVSNHGGRQLDTALATLEALPAVAEAIAGRIPVLLDGGIRRGTDILKALALGASAVLVGRPVLWGLAVDGEDGVWRVLELLRRELDLAMALAGAPTLADVTRDLLR